MTPIIGFLCHWTLDLLLMYNYFEISMRITILIPWCIPGDMVLITKSFVPDFLKTWWYRGGSENATLRSYYSSMLYLKIPKKCPMCHTSFSKWSVEHVPPNICRNAANKQWHWVMVQVSSRPFLGTSFNTFEVCRYFEVGRIWQ